MPDYTVNFSLHYMASQISIYHIETNFQRIWESARHRISGLDLSQLTRVQKACFSIDRSFPLFQSIHAPPLARKTATTLKFCIIILVLFM